MDVIAEIRRRFHVDHETITSLSSTFKLSRPTIRKHLKTVEEPVYHRQNQPHLKLGSFHQQLEAWLEQEAHFPRKQRRTAQRLYEGLQVEGYLGSYSVVQRYVRRWKKQRASSPSVKQAFVPLAFPAGETCQFDWSQETVLLGDVVQTSKVAHFRLSYSRQMFVVAYPRETQEMVLDAHSKAFTYFGGVPKRMVYDNLKTVVDAIFVGKERRFNRRFLAPGSRYFCESFYGPPSPTSGKNYATANACGCPSRPGHSIATQQGVAHMLSNDSTRFRKACIFTSQAA